jgi:hypothetical protein
MKLITQTELIEMERLLAALFHDADRGHERDQIATLHERLLDAYESQRRSRSSADRLRQLSGLQTTQ